MIAKMCDGVFAGFACPAFIGDKALDANWLRAYLARRGIETAIPICEGTAGHRAARAERYKWNVNRP
jgi:hypothetical protein